MGIDKNDLYTLHPVDEWYEELGDVLWYHIPIQEYPVVGVGPGDGEKDRYGVPTDCQRLHDEGWFTHFSFLPASERLRMNGPFRVIEE